VCERTAECEGGAREKRLLNDIFGDVRQYNKLERPVVNESDALTVKFGLVLQQIIDVVYVYTDIASKILTFSVL